MTPPEQGRSGGIFWVDRGRRPVKGQVETLKMWEVVGLLAGSKSKKLFAEESDYDEAISKLRKLLKSRTPKAYPKK